MRTFLLVFLVFFAAGLCFSQELEADWYQGKPIRDIRFEGLKHIRLSELDGVTDSYKGKIFTDELFLDLQGALYGLEYFESITPSAQPIDAAGTAVVILFRVVERPTISRITFVGNSGVKRRDLLDTVSVKVNDVANKMVIRADEQAILKKYEEKGFPDATVRSETRPDKNDTVEILFFVNEGEKITITNIFFEGNSIYSSSSLKGQLSMKDKGFRKDGAFQDSRLTADREAIVRYYRDRGYLDAEVADVIQDMTKDAKGNNNLSLTYRIYEGGRYNFEGISFEGNDIFTTEQLEELVRSKLGETANASRIEGDLQRVADLYYENGYIFNTIDREEHKNPETGIVAYRIIIVERGRAHIENIIIRGNKKTKDSVILREIPLETGDVFSKTKVMNALHNLYNLQFFSVVMPDTPQGSADSLMDLIINVEEQPTTDIQFGLTFSGSADPNDFPVSGLLAWTDRNFLGYGNQVRAQLTASPSAQSLSLEYSQRWLFNLPLSWGVDVTVNHAIKGGAMNNGINGPLFNGDEDRAYPDGFHSYEEYEAASKIPPDEFLMDYEQWYLSLGLSATYRWSTFLGTLGTGGGVRTGVLTNKYDDMLRPFDPVIRERNGEWTPVNSLWTIVYLDKRDLYYDPSSGYYGSQRFGYYGLFDRELEHYIRSDTKAEYYYTLYTLPITDKYNLKTVLALHSGMSFILPQFHRDQPVVEDASKLYIDGMFLGRGWYDERMNRGFALWENWVELRTPLVPNLLAFDIFGDADLAKATPGDLFHHTSSSDWRFSMGAGFRFTLAQFPFRFLFAKRFKIVDGAVEWQQGTLFRNAFGTTSEN
ncbi:MAG: outer membrane protein assembly factor BamA [Treponema sp.]|nr:outer membrane protein assembly factor BamA [Treponema sp.]